MQFMMGTKLTPQLVRRLGTKEVVLVMTKWNGLVVRYFLRQAAGTGVMRIGAALLLPAKPAADDARQRPDPFEVSWIPSREPARRALFHARAGNWLAVGKLRTR